MNCKHKLIFIGKGIVSLTAALVVSGLLFLPSNGMATTASTIYTMNDGGSLATINPNSSAGMSIWSVNGQNQLNQQWFWYSVNGSAPQPINTIGGLTTTPSGANDLTVTYQNSLLSVNVDYTLNGNGVNSGSADIMEYIWINNLTSDQTLNVSFFQYSNFNLLQNHNNTVSISGSPGAYTGAFQSTGTPGGSGIAEVILAPSANHGETALVPTTLNELNNPANTNYFNLSDNTSAVTGDVSWAFQWDATLNPGDEEDISKDKGLQVSVVPEPTSMGLIALGMGALGLARRRQ